MVRLTPELIEDSFQYVNPVRQYELNLRNYKIGLIENLGATLNQFDSIDFTDNDVRRLDGFPYLPKIKSLHFSNNKIQHVCSNLEVNLPNLETLIIINNNIEDLTEIDQLASIKSLRTLSLLRNPVANLKHYRLYTIYRIPGLRVLDFKKVKEKERDQAQQLFKGKKLKSSNKVKTFVPGSQLDKLTLSSQDKNNQNNNDQDQSKQRAEKVKPTKEEIDAIRMAISQAKSIEEIEQLNQMLRSGIIPSHLKKPQQQTQSDNVVEEEDEEEDGNDAKMPPQSSE